MRQLLAVDQLNKTFHGFQAVDNVSFTANAGEIFGLLGPNGAGKTTTIRMIGTVLSPDSGTVKAAGFNTEKDPEMVRSRIGVLTTELGVYERFSGRENLEYFGKLYHLRGKALSDRIDELVQSLEMSDFIGRRAGGYSTGQKQKLAIARSIIHNPEVIIFDEPTSGLDVLAAQTVLRFMKEARAQGKLVIFSTHQMHDAEDLCDRAAIMHRGRVIANDTVAALKSRTQAQSLAEAFLTLVQGKK